jgi:glycosyltransferase involved in cell wall biosynthesis
MGEALLVSICIPAYQRKDYLKRLLDSIEMQTFRRFEVVITDDSPGGEVLDMVEDHPLKPLIRYFKNPRTLGSPENWNEGLRKAKADWIKIMHDDDWFTGPDSLGVFADAIQNRAARFYFSAYTNVYPGGRTKTIRIKDADYVALNKMPEILIAANRIGPPSAVIFKKDHALVFDNRMQWLVDIDFYIRYLKNHPPAGYISNLLVQIGVSESQVTSSSFGKPEIEIPERFMLFEKMEPAGLNNILIFDSWWRFIRNLKITDNQKIPESGYLGKIPDVIQGIIKFQKHIPKALLNAGLFSKFFMGIHFFLLRRKK